MNPIGRLQSKAPPLERIADPSNDLDALPSPVRAMRAALAAAARSGDIEALRPAIERSRTLPTFARGTRPANVAAVIEILKARSFDGQGAETLSILRAIFEQPYARARRGAVETFVWPAFAVRQRPNPTPDERVAMYRCSRFANIALTNDIGLPLIERVGVGADGAWAYFQAG